MVWTARVRNTASAAAGQNKKHRARVWWWGGWWGAQKKAVLCTSAKHSCLTFGRRPGHPLLSYPRTARQYHSCLGTFHVVTNTHTGDRGTGSHHRALGRCPPHSLPFPFVAHWNLTLPHVTAGSRLSCSPDGDLEVAGIGLDLLCTRARVRLRHGEGNYKQYEPEWIAA